MLDRSANTRCSAVGRLAAQLAAAAVAALVFVGGAAGVVAASTAHVSAGAPVNTSPPTVPGSAQQDQTLTASTGSWSGEAPISYVFAWQRCGGSGGSCGDISGASARTYLVGSADVGRTLRVVVTATNSVGRASAVSSPTGTVVAVGTLPSISRQPDLHGKAVVGRKVSVDRGRWSGTLPMTYSYQWQRCSSGGVCIDIGGATRSWYVPVAGDAGYRLRATVIARNSVGSASASSNQSGVVVTFGTAPSVHEQPDLHGSAQVGRTLTVDHGSWYGTTPINYGYQWQRCSSGGVCTDIGGATTSSYVPVGADVGYRLRATVTARNSVGSASASSNSTAAVVAAATAPSVHEQPGLHGRAQVGQTVTVDNGRWDGTSPIAYSYRWQRCTAGGSCTDISGAARSSYVPVAGDVGYRLRAIVTATNSAGTASAASSPTGTVVAAASPPSAYRQPDVHGRAQVGQTVTVDNGRWYGTTPISYSYQWQRCTAGGTCTDIGGATKSSYVPVAGDVGYRLRATVTARNSVGSASIASNLTAAVVAVGSPPSAHRQPDTHGSAQVGQTVTVDNGSWYGTTPISYSYQWQRCTAGGTCTDIGGATKSSYVPVAR